MAETVQTPNPPEQKERRAEPLPHIPIETVVRRIDGVSTLPHVALKVIRLANDPESSTQDLKDAVESDPALSARVLKCINSSAYALRSKITNLHQAISFLGFTQVRNLTITGSVSEAFKNEEEIGVYRRPDLWRHMVSVAVCARLIAARRKLPEFEEAFLAGLLHDLGIVLEDQFVPDEFRAMIQSLDSDRPLADQEHEYLGFDHTLLGASVAEEWKFPSAVRAAIRYHHQPESYQGEDAPIIHCVAVANLICSLKGAASVGMSLVRLPRAALTALSLQKEDLNVLAADLDHEISLYDALFRM